MNFFFFYELAENDTNSSLIKYIKQYEFLNVVKQF